MILFRADGNKNIGSGHIMRCLSIADYLKNCGEYSIFLTASSDLDEIINTHGHKVEVLHSDYSHMMSDIVLTQKWVEAVSPVVLFVDSYYVTNEYLISLKQCCKNAGTKLVYIDDLLAFPYPCDILLNYSISGVDREKEYCKMYREMDMPKMLLGPAYVPLRAEFQNKGTRKVKRCAENILISTGGADSEHVLLELTKEIIRCEEELRGLHFHAIIGPLNKDETILNEITKYSYCVTTYSNVQAMSELMQNCDLAISAAGSTLYELCAMQTPTITYILADNQIYGAKGFMQRKIMECAGDLRLLGVSSLANTLIKQCVLLVNDYEKRKKITEKQKETVDGQGTKRIWEYIKGCAL